MLPQVRTSSNLLDYANAPPCKPDGADAGDPSALPVFLGLIVGDIVNPAVWIVLGNLTGIGCNIMPG